MRCNPWKRTHEQGDPIAPRLLPQPSLLSLWETWAPLLGWPQPWEDTGLPTSFHFSGHNPTSHVASLCALLYYAKRKPVSGLHLCHQDCGTQLSHSYPLFFFQVCHPHHAAVCHLNPGQAWFFGLISVGSASLWESLEERHQKGASRQFCSVLDRGMLPLPPLLWLCPPKGRCLLLGHPVVLRSFQVLALSLTVGTVQGVNPMVVQRPLRMKQALRPYSSKH